MFFRCGACMQYFKSCHLSELQGVNVSFLIKEKDG